MRLFFSVLLSIIANFLFCQKASDQLSLAQSMRFTDQDSSLLLAKSIYQKNKINNSIIELDAINLIYHINQDRMDLDSALKWASIGVERATIENDPMYQFTFKKYKAISFRHSGLLDSALYYVQLGRDECLEYYGLDCEDFIIELGTIFHSQKRYTEAEEQYKLALKNATRDSDFILEIIARTELVNLYREIELPDSFSYHLEILSKKFPFKTSKPGVLKLHGEIDFLLHDPSSMPFYEKSLESHLEQENFSSYYLSASKIINYYHAQNEIEKAKALIDRSIGLLENQSKFKQNQVFYYQLYENRIQAKDYKAATEALLEYQKKNEIFIKLELQEKTKDLEIKYETEKKEKDLERSKADLQKKTYQQNILIGLFILGSFIAVFFIFFLKKRNAFKQKLSSKEIEIQNQKISELEKEKKILSLAAMLEGQEAERTRIAKDLHDGLGGLLSTVKAHFGKISNEIKKSESKEVYVKATDMIDEACNEVRRISHNLMPGALRVNGLGIAIEQLANELRTTHKFNVDIQIIKLDERLEETKEVFVYRIIQELTNNILKHSNAKNILIQIGRYEDQILLLVEDDGKGFDFEKVDDHKGIGLRSLKSRVDFLNGTIDIDSRINLGTSTSINIPL
jgi:signal transduction histidine kinase